MKSARTRAAVAAARSAARLSRLVGLGQGTAAGGRLARAIDPRVLRELTRDRPVVLVTGTNGKTTTTAMIAAALRAEYGSVVTNATGSNMPQGQICALAEGADEVPVVLEVDELYLAAVAEEVEPAAFVLLNLTRDQLHRAHETSRVASRIRTAVEGQPDAVVIANADDPAIVACVGGPDAAWFATGWFWAHDSASCPRCGALLSHGHGDWWCTCGLRRPQAQWWTQAGWLHSPEGSPVRLHPALPGAANVANATAAVAAAVTLGCSRDTAVRAVTGITEVAARYARVTIGGRPARLLLAKNPAGWSAGLEVLDPQRPVVLVVNARGPDGRDPSWLWDVEMAPLRTRRVLVSGERAADVATRLRYAGVTAAVYDTPRAAIAAAETEPDVIANYTAFEELRRAAGHR